MLSAVVGDTASVFGRALVMPNLKPPCVTTAQVAAYRARILAALPAGHAFEPVMAAYLTDQTSIADLIAGFQAGVIGAVKLYPAHATTNSAAGVRDIADVQPVLEAMAEHDIPLCVHGEVTDVDVDVFDREAVFIDRVLAPLVARLPTLRVVLEHITTAQGVAFVQSARPGVAGTLTVHHLLINRNAMFDGGLRPHHYCLPVAKREEHRLALVQAALSGDARFFLGTDSAPHLVTDKERDCGCAGLYTAPVALPLLAGLFADAGALDRLAGFVSVHGARFYRRPIATDMITLHEVTSVAREVVKVSEKDVIQVFRGGERLGWSLAPAGTGQ